MDENSANRHWGLPARVKTPRAWCRPETLVATSLINLFALALPIVILQVYDRIVPNQSVGTLGILLSALLVAAVVDGVLRGVRSTFLGWSAARYEHAESLNAIDHVLQTDLSEFARSSTSTYLDRFQAIERVRDFFSGQAILMLVDLPFVIIFLSLIWVFAGTLVLIPLGVMAVFLCLSIISGRELRRAMHAQQQIDRRRQDFVLEVLQGIHTVKALAMEQLMMRRFERLQAQSAESISEVSRLGSISQGFGTILSQGVMVAFVSVGSLSVLTNDMSVGALAAGTMLVGRVLQPSLKAMGLWTQLQSLQLARDKLQEIYATPREAIHEGAEAITLSGDIVLENIHFRHEGSAEELLAGIDLHIRPGETIGITGPNGCGKSTLVNILMGFINPTNGHVALDGRDIHELDRSNVRGQIGLMPQHGVILQGTILENLTMFRDGEAVDEAIRLSKELGLDDFVMQMPDGLDTPIGGSQSTALSEGMRQLIILVRSLVGGPPIMVFDDANSALDIRHDLRLARMLRSLKGEHTMLIVSHRPSLLRLCDRTYTLENGLLTPRRGSEGPGTVHPLRPAPVAALASAS